MKINNISASANHLVTVFSKSLYSALLIFLSKVKHDITSQFLRVYVFVCVVRFKKEQQVHLQL